MPSFRYECMNKDGSATTGVLNAPDKAEAMRLIRDRGLTPINVELNTAARGGSLMGRRNARPTIKRAELANFVRELATALEAGLPLMQAMRTVREQARGPAMPVILDFLIERVEAGTPLFSAAKEYGDPFDDLVVGMFRAADASGRMD